jgi:hypothetical protein
MPDTIETHLQQQPLYKRYDSGETVTRYLVRGSQRMNYFVWVHVHKLCFARKFAIVEEAL